MKQSSCHCDFLKLFTAIRYIFYFLKKKVKGCRCKRSSLNSYENNSKVSNQGYDVVEFRVFKENKSHGYWNLPDTIKKHGVF